MSDAADGKCWAETALPEPPLIQNGSLVLGAHGIGWIVSGAFSIVAVLVSFWLIWQHLSWYTNKREQRYIVRILLMVPIYAVISFGSYVYYNHSTALLLIRDCYEAFVLTSFFYLLLSYLSHNPEEQKEIFRRVGLSRVYDRNAQRQGKPPSHWMFPIHFITWKPEDGLYFLQIMKWGVLQYCVVRPMTTLAAVILNYIGLYCEDSWGPGWGHVYITAIVSISVTIAMYCLLQLYMPVSAQLAPQKPILKLFAVKAVVFLTFWQATLISLLETFGVIKDTKYMTADNVATGIGAIMECVEMALFALLHVKAYTYIVYRDPAAPRLSRTRALIHALNFKETLVELWKGSVYMARRARGHETDRVARRGAVYESVFGKSRWDLERGNDNGEKAVEETKDRKKGPMGVEMEVEEVGDERQRLGLGDEDVYGIGYHSRRGREKSDGLEEQIERELTARGYRKPGSLKDRPDLGAYAPVGQDYAPPAHARTRAWWRDVYARISRSSADRDPDPVHDIHDEPDPLSKSFRRLHGYHVPQMSLDDPPPRSAIREYRDSQRSRKPPPTALHDLVALEPAPGSPPLLSPIRIPPRASPPRESVRRSSAPPDPLPFTLSQDSRTSSPSRDSLPRRPSAPPSSRDSDSFLGRAFRNLPEPTTSVEQLSTGPSSSQSHRTQVRLGAEPVVVPRALDTGRAPMLEGPTAHPSKAASPVVTSPRMAQYKAERARKKAPDLQGVPEDMMFEPGKANRAEWSRARRMSSPPGRPEPSRAHRSSRADEPKRRSLGGPTSSVSPPTSPGRPTRYTPRGVPIVLPSPLASAAGQGSSTMPSTSLHRSPFSPSGVLGSPLDTDYLRRDMT